MAKRRSRRWPKVLAALLTVFLVALVGASLYFYQYAFVPAKKSFLSNKMSRAEREARTWLSKTQKSTWTQKAHGADLKLEAVYVPAAKKSNKTIVVAHGYMGDKESMAPEIRLFHDAGYNVLAPDDRGHGKSEGDYIGYGYADRLDYLDWINRVDRHVGPRSEIALYGVSMGGATVMYLSGEKLPSSVKSIVEDSGYTSIIDELSYQAKSQFGIPKWPLVPAVALTATIRTGYNVFAASTLDSLKRNTRPMLFIHGANDTFVPTKMVHPEYKATKVEKALWIAPKTQHAQAHERHPEEFKKRVLSWFQAHWTN